MPGSENIGAETSFLRTRTPGEAQGLLEGTSFSIISFTCLSTTCIRCKGILYAPCLIGFSIDTVLIFCLTTEVRPKSKFEEANRCWYICRNFSACIACAEKNCPYIDQAILENQFWNIHNRCLWQILFINSRHFCQRPLVYFLSSVWILHQTYTHGCTAFKQCPTYESTSPLKKFSSGSKI